MDIVFRAGATAFAEGCGEVWFLLPLTSVYPSVRQCSVPREGCAGISRRAQRLPAKDGLLSCAAFARINGDGVCWGPRSRGDERFFKMAGNSLLQIVPIALRESAARGSPGEPGGSQ